MKHPRYSRKMVPFIYLCPVTGLKVQALLAYEGPAEESNTYEAITRLAHVCIW